MRSTSDLREYLEAIDVCYFDSHLDDLGVEIRWMRARGGEPTRLGQYWFERKTIEIARHLADESIPRFYVMSVIHHEALHAVHGPEHDRAFHLAERQFLFAFEVAQWERENASKPWPQAPKGLR